MTRKCLALLHIAHIHIDFALNIAWISCTYMEPFPGGPNISRVVIDIVKTLFALPANLPPHLEHDIVSHSSKPSTAYNALAKHISELNKPRRNLTSSPPICQSAELQ